MKKSVSILICSYNGKERLTETLTSLSNLDINSLDFVELVFIDNASTDGTLELAEQTWKSLKIPFAAKFEKELSPGKLIAQEKGISICEGEFILICDDDNSLNKDYLQIGIKIFENNPQVGVIGGCGIPASTVSIPKWFNEYAYNYACAPQAAKTGNVIPTRNVVYGAGMWFVKKYLENAKLLGVQFILPSRSGRKLTTGGEDSELCWAIKYLGYEIWYCAELKFIHHIPENRLNKNYLKKLMRGMKQNTPLGRIYLRVWKNKMVSPVKIYWLKEVVYTIISLAKILFSLNSQKGSASLYFNNLVYYLKNRSRYDKHFNSIISYYKACTNKSTNQ